MEPSSPAWGASTASWRHEVFLRGGRLWVPFAWLLVVQTVITAERDPLQTWWTLLLLTVSVVGMTISVLATRLPHDARAVLFISALTTIALIVWFRGGSGLIVATLCSAGMVFAATTLSSARTPWVLWAVQLVLFSVVVVSFQLGWAAPVVGELDVVRLWRGLAVYALGSATVLHALQQIVVRYEESLTRLAQEAKLRGELMRQLETAEDAERLRLSQELHDDVAQRLAALKIDLELKATSNGPVPAEALKSSGRLVGDVLTSLRDLAQGLRPPLLDELGLVEALRALCRTECEREGVAWSVDAAAERLVLSKEVEVAVFRLLHEALRNALHHGRPRTIRVQLAANPDGLVFSLEDDGVGFDLDEAARRAARDGRFGLLGMRERVSSIGGRLTIASRPSKTVISGWLPLTAEARSSVPAREG